MSNRHIGLRKVREFLALYRAGASITRAARQLGLSREHCSRSVKRRALGLVSERFALLALEHPRTAPRPLRPAALRAS